MKKLKYGIQLWRDLSFYVWNGHGIKINDQIKRIEIFAKEHPVYNFIASCLK